MVRPLRSPAAVFRKDTAHHGVGGRPLSDPSPGPAASPGLAPILPGLDRLCVFSGSGELPPRAAFPDWQSCRRPSRLVLLPARFGLCLRLVVGILELLGCRAVALHISHVSEMEDLCHAGSGLSGISALC